MKLLRKAIGAAENKQSIENIMTIFSDYFALKPPRYVVKFPPAITPQTGPVILMIANEINTVF